MESEEPRLVRPLRYRCGFADMMISVLDAECAQTLPQPLGEREKTLGWRVRFVAARAVLQIFGMVIGIDDRDGRHVYLGEANVALDTSSASCCDASVQVVAESAQLFVAIT